MGDVEASLALQVRAEHAESPVWDADAGCLWWVDITGRRVHRFDPATGQDCSWGTAGQPGGVVLGADGQVVLGLPDGLGVLDNSGATTLVVPVEADLSGEPQQRPEGGQRRSGVGGNHGLRPQPRRRRAVLRDRR